jgi:hypothetical protein
VRNLTRVLLFPFAVVALLLGAFGALVRHLPDHAATGLARDGLEFAARRLVELEVGAPRDLASTLEHWTGETPLCYALLGLGAGLLAFVLGAIGGGAAPRLPARGGEREIEVKLDKNQAKKVLKEAQALRKRGDLVEAAELLWSNETARHRRQLLHRGRRVLARRRDPPRPESLRGVRRAPPPGRELRDRRIDLRPAGQWDKAADCYLKAGLKSVAAEMFEKAGKFARAARAYRESEFMRHAAAMYVKCKDCSSPAEALEAVFVDEGAKSMMDPRSPPRWRSSCARRASSS